MRVTPKIVAQNAARKSEYRSSISDREELLIIRCVFDDDHCKKSHIPDFEIATVLENNVEHVHRRESHGVSGQRNEIHTRAALVEL